MILTSLSVILMVSILNSKTSRLNVTNIRYRISWHNALYLFLSMFLDIKLLLVGDWFNNEFECNAGHFGSRKT